jgi:hypothetical protein
LQIETEQQIDALSDDGMNSSIDTATSTVVEGDLTRHDLRDIPLDMSPQDMLAALPDNTRIEICILEAKEPGAPKLGAPHRKS